MYIVYVFISTGLYSRGGSSLYIVYVFCDIYRTIVVVELACILYVFITTGLYSWWS